jgi:hypothetical protein
MADSNIPAATAAALIVAEWKRRYAAHVMEKAGWNERAAMRAAEGGYELHQHTPEADLPNPEDEADEEMSHWEDDGE